jgi:hypothetical protein
MDGTEWGIFEKLQEEANGGFWWHGRRSIEHSRRE